MYIRVFYLAEFIAHVYVSLQKRGVISTNKCKSPSIYYLIESSVMCELLLRITKQRDEHFDTSNQIIYHLPC